MQPSLSADALYARIDDGAQNLPPPPWTLLAETQASFVFDLGDGSILKAVRKRGGLSSGEARLRRETGVLRAFEGLGGECVCAPAPIAAGDCETSGFLDIPLAGWFRSKKIEGRSYTFDMFSMLPSERRERMGERLGAAIATLHQCQVPEIFVKLGDPVARQLGLAAQSLPFPQDLPKLRRLETLWSGNANDQVLVHGKLVIENVLWSEGGVVAFTGWSEAGLGDAAIDLAFFESFGPLRDAVLRGYGAGGGKRPDMTRYRLAAAAHALVMLALEGDQGHPREGMRRRRMFEEYLFQAGIE